MTGDSHQRVDLLVSGCLDTCDSGVTAGIFSAASSLYDFGLDIEL